MKWTFSKISLLMVRATLFTGSYWFSFMKGKGPVRA